MKLLLIICCILLCAGCQKKDNTVADPAKVSIQITSPAQGQVYHYNDTVYITGSISYPGELHGYEVMLTDTATGFVVYDEASHIHTDHFVISNKWPATATQPTALKLVIIANVDHTGDDARKELNISIQP